MNRADLTPWIDRAGRFSPLRLIFFIALMIPATAVFADLAFGPMRAEPLAHAMDETGEWALRVLLLSLAVTPLRRFAPFRKLITVRRMVGLFAFAYLATHFSLYILHIDLKLGLVAAEIISRIYLMIGFAALLGFSTLAATSFDRAIRRMGRNWRRLHSLSWLFTAMGLLHFFMQAKIDVSGPTMLAGIFTGLAFLRFAAPRGMNAFAVVFIAAAVGGLGAAGLEAGWHSIGSGVPVGRILAANLDFSYEIRPPWRVAAFLIAPAILAACLSGAERARGFIQARAQG